MLTTVEVLCYNKIIKSTFHARHIKHFALQKNPHPVLQTPHRGLHHRVKSPSSQQVRIANIDLQLMVRDGIMMGHGYHDRMDDVTSSL